MAILRSPARSPNARSSVRAGGESLLIDLMNECLARYPQLKVFSLPRMGPDRYVELGVRGEAALVPTAIAQLQEGVSKLGLEWSEPVIAQA